MSRRRIIWDSRHSAGLTTNKDNELQRLRLLLLRYIKQFRNLQAIYMPAATIMLNKDEASQQALPEANRRSSEAKFQLLWLLSSLPADHHKHNCNANLVEIEIKLCEEQCHDALDKVRSLQRGRLSFIGFRNWNIRGQNPNTRAKDTLDRLEDKTKAIAVKYMAARDALLALQGPGSWEKELRPLMHGDLTTPDGQEISIEIPGDTVGPDGRTLSKKKRKAELLDLGQGENSFMDLDHDGSGW
jgi:hypothetical protein